MDHPLEVIDEGGGFLSVSPILHLRNDLSPHGSLDLACDLLTVGPEASPVVRADLNPRRAT